jgi:hypothetical protein
VSAGKTTIDTAYEIDKISQWVDLFSIYLFSSFLAHLDRRTMWTITIAITLFYSPFVLPGIVCECLFLFSGASIVCSNFLFVCPVWYDLSICIFGEHVLSVPTFFFLVFLFSTMPLWIVGFTSICIITLWRRLLITSRCLRFRATLYQSKKVWDLATFVLLTLCPSTIVLCPNCCLIQCLSYC